MDEHSKRIVEAGIHFLAKHGMRVHAEMINGLYEEAMRLADGDLVLMTKQSIYDHVAYGIGVSYRNSDGALEALDPAKVVLVWPDGPPPAPSDAFSGPDTMTVAVGDLLPIDEPAEPTAPLAERLMEQHYQNPNWQPEPDNVMQSRHWVWCGLCCAWVGPNGLCQHGITGV